LRDCADIDVFDWTIPAGHWRSKGTTVAPRLPEPNPAKMGSTSELCKIFPVAAVRNVAVMPHSFYHGPSLLAAIHVTAALWTPGAIIEWRSFDLEAQLYSSALAPEGGRILVP
jgi:L-alanine-DL-glutamate epimerase-like enolase superfamily enzyme